ncbi:hypothetical protein CAOG_00453 [Capsaspora owczarzaki ATCC 30864]|uniref:LicD/FKTN/FKRP nucleotidyltransferase domain-containing protein n=1 Tax=Capsaspora owczarzaki (strain ATCC 30864) TaxID=595528 RepID=A0A0D2WH54_CAPO3|nr:hypothetical protein CAOG_00453 [Capsaspora owczarzaki ATCC 30864]KJE88880.1 hypothetical protein CAOG_000453 [Capsaspora owczarzaki ATCC 30864]|eukprot:XP_004365324.1 hypothetical protein CAOG_00453 [Capsaspora owczarzaki ATCC 30864]
MARLLTRSRVVTTLAVLLVLCCYFYNWILAIYWMMVNDCTTPKFYQDSVYKIVGEVARLYEEHDIPYFLDQGTLLGAARNQGMLPHDSDVDINILHKDLKRAYDLFQSHPWLISQMQYNDGCYVLRVYDRSLGVDTLSPHIDSFHYFELEDQKKMRFVHGGDFLVEDFFPPVKVPFGPHSLYAPRHFHQILVTRFGANYMVNKKVRLQDCKESITMTLFGRPV